MKKELMQLVRAAQIKEGDFRRRLTRWRKLVYGT